MPPKLRATGFSIAGDAVFDSFYSDEAEVAGVLFHLPDLIRRFESARRFPPCWGAKRRRSVNDAPPELLPVNGKLEYVSSSPTSPLTFSSNAADLDTKHLLISNEELAPTGFKEVRKPELSCDRRMAENTKLQEVHESVSSSLELQSFSKSQPLVHHQEMGMGPRGIPDLNVPAEEYGGGLDWGPSQLSEHHYMAAAVQSRAEAAALARQRRHLIQKSKRATRGFR